MDIDPESAKLAAEFVQRNLSEIVDFAKNSLKDVSNKVKLRLPNTYKSYLATAATKYGRAKSFFIRSEPTSLYDFYVPLGISLGDNKISNVSYTDVVGMTTRAVVIGAAGSGKSMFMRHLFLSSLFNGNKVPIFIELRNANSSDAKLIDLITESLENLGLGIGESYISNAFQAGHFAVFLDGYDEISYSLRDKCSRDILNLSRQAINCPIMVSSRPDDIFNGWEEFSTLQLNALNVNEASELVTKLPYDDELKKKFLVELRSSLFERHESFLSNPLLLSIMLLTYGMSADIPQKLSVFYNQAYEALFQRHDASKGGYQRDRRCNLDSQDFSKVFAAFCVQTYDRREFQFSRLDAISYIEKAKGISEIAVDSGEFLDDALQSVCLLVEDGLFLVFAHRSFQEYFVGRFVNESTPEIQRSLIDRFWRNIRSDNVFQLLYEINPDLVERELIIPKLNDLFKKLGVKRKVGITHFTKFLKTEFDKFKIHDGVTFSIEHNVKHNKPDNRFFDIVYFTVKRNDPESWDKWYKPREAKKFASKYFIKDKKNEIDLSKLTYRSQFIRDLSSTDGILSVAFLEAAYQSMKKLEAKRKHAGRSLEELLSVNKQQGDGSSST